MQVVAWIVATRRGGISFRVAAKRSPSHCVRAHRPSISHSIEHPHARITLPGMASRPIRSEASMQLVLSHITYTYPGSSEPALRDVSVTFPQGWTGIGATTAAERPRSPASTASAWRVKGTVLFDMPPLSYRPAHARPQAPMSQRGRNSLTHSTVSLLEMQGYCRPNGKWVSGNSFCRVVARDT